MIGARMELKNRMEGFVKMMCRVRKMKIDSIEPVVEIINNMSISSAELPEPVNLEEVIIHYSLYM